MKCSWPCIYIEVFGPYLPSGISKEGKNRSQEVGGPLLKNCSSDQKATATILYDFHVCKWKNAHIKDLNALRILMNFLCIYLGEGKEGCTNACMHVYVWEHIVIAFTTEPLGGCLRNLVGIKCSWPRTCIYRFFRPYPPRGGSREGGPFLKKNFFQTARLQQPAE